MADSPLILTPLKRALATLEEALLAPDSGFVRDAIVKPFECTYEVACRSLLEALARHHGA